VTHFFEQYTRPMLDALGSRTVLEIGASHGEHTDRLMWMPQLHVTASDPCLDKELVDHFQPEPRVIIIKDISLNVLPSISGPFDCVLIDGDHNWYTVFNELKIIHDRQLLSPNGIILFHDTRWPYARRDMYYQPELIPEEHRQPYANRGIIEGQSELAGAEDFNAHLCNALTEGGSKNGVRTAVEDFVKSTGKAYIFKAIEEENGLGILVPKSNAAGVRVISEFVARKERDKRLAEMGAKINRISPGLHRLAKRIIGRGPRSRR
jgi:hypothetical protein